MDAEEQLIIERDAASDAADSLSDAIGRLLLMDFGDHSNMNCPWANALDAIEDEIERRKKLAASAINYLSQ